MNLFKELSPEEVLDFKKSARDNYELFTEISTVWHPEYSKECAAMNLESHNNGKTKQL